MNVDGQHLVLSASPFLKRREDTPYIMRHVLYALLPAVGASIYCFGFQAFLVLASCVAGAVLTEWVFNRDVPAEALSIRDASAVLTGVLLALTLPPGIALWMAVLGGVVAVGVGKLIFGGLGQNIFNPSLVGRAFLQASFPVALTTWAPLQKLNGFFSVSGDTLNWPFMKGSVDAVTTATPLAKLKFEHQTTELLDLFVGNTAGSLGETSAVLLLLGGAYLAYRKFLNWRIPIAIFTSVLVFAGIFHILDAQRYPMPLYHLFSGGLVLGAVFMATDPVSSPITHLGCWIFGIGVGVLVTVIRLFGGLPEGVMYAILLMNGFTPLINRFTEPRIYGTSGRFGGARQGEQS